MVQYYVGNSKNLWLRLVFDSLIVFCSCSNLKQDGEPEDQRNEISEGDAALILESTVLLALLLHAIDC